MAPKHVHNMAWGDDDGQTLYLCGRSGLYRMRLNIPGIRPEGPMRSEPETSLSTGWLQMVERAPTDFVDARLQLHWAVQLVSAVGTALLPAAADDSHTNLEWLPEPGLLAGRLTADAPRCRAALRVSDLRLYLLNEGGTASAQHALAGMTLDQGLVWLEQEIAAFWQHPLPTPLRRPQLDLPDHAVGHGAVFRVPNAAAFAEIGRWYANGESVLRGLAERTRGASPVRCWPHHFDIATLVTLEGGHNSASARTIGIGLSPGDATYAEPYWYVTPWPYPDEPLLSALDGGGEWHRTGWLGAVLTGSKIAAEPSAEAQARLVNAFLGSAVDACRALLST